MRTTITTLALTTLIGLGTTATATAHPAASPEAADQARTAPVREKGIVLECTGRADGLSAYVNLYENDVYSNYLQVRLNDDPALSKSREPADILRGTDVRTSLLIKGLRARVTGTATKVGPKKPVHQEVDDAGQHVVMDGFHRRLAHELTLTYDGTTVPLRCAPAFAYVLNVTKTDTTGD